MIYKGDRKKDLTSGHDSLNKNMSFKSSILRSDLCYYNDAYIGLKGRYNY